MRLTLALLGVLGIALSFVTEAASTTFAASTRPTRIVQTVADEKYDLRTSRNIFAPFDIAQNTKGGGGSGDGKIGQDTVVLCYTITGNNPQALFLVGSNRVYATLATPIGTLSVQSIGDGYVTFSDGSSIQRTDCTSNVNAVSSLPQPEMSLPPGSSALSPAGGEVPGPLPTYSSVPPPEPSPSPSSGGVLVTPTLAPVHQTNPYGSPPPQDTGVPVYVIRSPQP